MADSEDEYDRKRRDKFRGERSAGGGENYRPERRDDRRPGLGGAGARDDWAERNPFRGATSARPRPDYYRGPRDRYGSPPPAKRMRQDWGDELRSNPRYGGYEAYMMHAWNEHYAAHNMHNVYGHGPPSHMRDPLPSNDTQTQPAMLTLKQFLDTQDDGISDAEVLRKYTDYKLEFKRQQLNEFFVAHKDEEWFKNKYHPIDSVNRKEEQLSFLKRRVEVFNEVLEKGLIKQISIDTNQTDPLLRLLDTVVIKLEGGNDDDLKILDEKPKELPVFEKKSEPDDDVIITAVTTRKEEKEDEEEETPKLVSPRPEQAVVDSDTENWDDDPEPEPAVTAPVEIVEEFKEKVDKKEKTLKRKRTHSNSSSSSSTSSSSSSSNSSEEEEEDKMAEKYDVTHAEDEAKAEQKDEDTDMTSANAPEETSNADNDKVKIQDQEKGEESQDKLEEENTDEKIKQTEAQEDEPSKDVDEKHVAQPEPEIETIDLETEKDTPVARALHRTSSIFLRNLAPTITKVEIENLCKGFDGFLRVAIADPLAERRWYRRGWVTFKRDVNIKEICWNLNNTRLRDCEMGAIVNRDLSRRVRPVNGMTGHKTIVRADIKLCAKVAMILDDKFKLWEKDQRTDQAGGNRENGNSESNKQNSSISFGFKSANPVLQNITDFLIEEASAEEEELLGISGEKEKEADGEITERDPQLIAVLDNLILYLRIVHSVDFYNHCEYPYEDEMPNRCGIIHARGPPPTKVSSNDLQDYIKSFENKMQPFLTKTVVIDDEELKNLGCKNAEAEVEKFVQSNTQELAKDKWLCPLSGKKFKGPEFIRKHIFNKHAEKVDEVRKEVEYYNNYLKDPKRPQLPEHPGNNKRNNSESNNGPSHGYRAPMYPSAYPMPYGGYAPPMMIPPRGGRGFGVGSGMRRPGAEYRQLIQYRDLDAPQEPLDMFN